MSPPSEAPSKIRCVKSTPKANQTGQRKLSDFLVKPKPKLAQPATLLMEHCPKICEFMKDVVKQPLTDEPERTVVRGKVTNVVKLNLLKAETGPYFHLLGTITDHTASLDVCFSSQVYCVIFK